MSVLSTKVEIEHDFAKLGHNNSTSFFITYETSLDKKESKYCKNVSLFLPLDGQYETKISFEISSKLLNDPGTMPNFNSSRVILSDLSVLTRRDSVWAAECNGNETCVPNLTFTSYISFDHNKDPYIIGSSETETINMTVQNIGEMAYDPCVRVHIIGVNVFMIPTDCQYEGSSDEIRLLCEPSRPIRTNNTWITGQIELEMKHLTNLDRNVTINMHLFDHCDDVATLNITKTIFVKAESGGIIAKGETDIGSIVNMTKEDIEENGKKIQHIYTINNNGRFNWKNLEVRVNLQKKPYIKYGSTPIIVIVYSPLKNSYPSCQVVSQNKTSMFYVCLIESLMKTVEIAKILIPMYIVPGVLDGILDKDKNVTTMSSVDLKLIGNDSKHESIITTITFQEASPVSIETLIIAIIVGICIFVIIIVILYRFGFLRRKKRDELNKLKRELKRQTIIRRSTMPSQALQAPDRSQLLESIEEANDNTQDLKQDKPAKQDPSLKK
ncbi:hypothetical protein PYW07_003648 [Mythimna separata]|uniref:Integrin alpha second immunoglobulin-like domain-containing protein n=1 Tax=Mythimna separata TaxID=271217 RepID=A0AAD7YNN0_MYTSE|nr:hypothetical protein PYW07_003648 [Mythimna separata]